MSTTVTHLVTLRRGRVLAHVELGLTLYLPQAPTIDEILSAYSQFRAICPPRRRALLASTHTRLFLPLEADDISHVSRCLAEQAQRQDSGIVVWDGQDKLSWSFWMQGLPQGGSNIPSASFCQIVLPCDVPADSLFSLAYGVAQKVRIASGHAGYTAQFDARFKNEAFNRIYAWAKRYLGIEVEDLNLTLPCVLDAIKGVNWLTLVGVSLWEKLCRHGEPVVIPDGLTVDKFKNAVLIKAGDEPILGDRNRGEFPERYADVEQILRSIKLEEHPEFAGRFADEHSTMEWIERFHDRDLW